MSPWLDTQTQAALQANPPEKLAPPEAANFALVMLRPGGDFQRLAAALCKVRPFTAGTVCKILARPCPNILCNGLSYPDAMFGQFEFVCCDAAVVFIAEGVIRTASEKYLNELYSWLIASREFEPVEVEVRRLPPSAEVDRFARQFLGWTDESEYAVPSVRPVKLACMRKKARIMQHWAAKWGGEVHIEGK